MVRYPREVRDPVDVLFVEDDPVQAKAIQAALAEAEGWDVERVETVERADEAVAEGGMDVAVVDYSLPDGTGLDVLETFQREAPGIPVVFLTGTGDEDVALQAMSQGAADYLSKGEDDVAEGLVDAIREATESFSGVTPVEIVDKEERDEARDRDRAGTTPGSGTGTRVEGTGEESSREAPEDLEGLLDAVVEPPVLGLGVFDDRGKVLAARFPDDVEADAAGVLSAAVAHQFEGLSGVFDLGIEGQYLLGRGDAGLLGLTVIPGPMIVVLVLETDVPRAKATERLFQVAAQVWEARK